MYMDYPYMMCPKNAWILMHGMSFIHSLRRGFATSEIRVRISTPYPVQCDKTFNFNV